VTTRASAQPTTSRLITDQKQNKEVTPMQLAVFDREADNLSALTEQFDDEQLPCRVNDPELFFAESGATPEDTEGIVNYGRTIDGVLVTALLKEAPGGCRVSMRAKPGVDVQAIASMFGGGGHKAASGCFIPLPLPEAKKKLVGLLSEIV